MRSNFEVSKGSFKPSAAIKWVLFDPFRILPFGIPKSRATISSKLFPKAAAL
jgi:hypothetical protein